MTDEEKQEIVNLVIERVFLAIPEMVGNQMQQQAVLLKTNRDFYKEHDDFRAHKDVVASAVEQEEGKNPFAKYEDILKAAVPEIRRRIGTLKSLDMQTVDMEPKRDFGSFTPLTKTSNGVF